MATLQAGEKARMYALGKIARGGATRGGYVSARAFIAIDGVHIGFGGTPGAGHVGTIITSLSITDALNEAANTCQFRINGMVPAAGAEVKITLGSKNRLSYLFAGFALHVQQGYAADKPANINADVSAVDYTWLLGFTKVTKAYRSQSASTIAADLVATYAAANGFTSYAVAPYLPTLTEITFTNEELDQALTRLAERIGAYWYVDYQKDIHFFIDETLNGAPEVLTPAHKSLADVRKTADRTQVLTRVYVEGRGSNILGAVKAGDTLIPVEAVDMFEAAADVFAKVSPHGSEGAAEWVSYTGVIPGGAGSLVGPGVGPPGAPILARAAGTGLTAGTYKYAYTDVTPSGETLPSPLAVIDVGAPIPAPTVAPATVANAASAGVDIGWHTHAYTYVTGAGETTISPPSAAVVTQGPLTPVVPSGGIYLVEQFTGGGLPDGAYDYAVSYIGDAGGETNLAATYGWTIIIQYGNHTARIHCSRVSGDYKQIPAGVSQIKVYRTAVGAGGGGGHFYIGTMQPFGAGTDHFYLDDPGLPLGAPIPTTNTAQRRQQKIALTTTKSPDPAVTGVKIYRQRADVAGAPFKFVAQVNSTLGISYEDVTPDASLGAQPPVANTSGGGFLAVAVSGIAPGPSPTNARRIYRTAANGSTLRQAGVFNENTSTAFTDTLGDAAIAGNPVAPTSDTSGLQQVPGQVTAGSAAILVANIAPFEAGGGWAVIGNGEQVIRYLAKSGTTLTGIPATGIGAIVAAIAYNSTITAAPMLTGIPSSGPYAIFEDLNPGDEINLVVKREDAARQSALATMIKTGPGWREEWIQDRRLSIAEARNRGDATLALRPLEDVTITYTCRDLRTASGKSITVNLPAPTNITGTFKIQSVTIGNFRPFPNQYPTFSVTASSNQFSFEDWLRQMQTKV
jgi:hypothetical protein